jgi:hypothetical protein
MLTIVWNPNGFQLIGVIPKEERYSAWYYIDNTGCPAFGEVLSPVVDQRSFC